MPPKSKKLAAARARAGLQQHRQKNNTVPEILAADTPLGDIANPLDSNAPVPLPSPEYIVLELDDDTEDCCFSGHVSDLVDHALDWQEDSDDEGGESDAELEDIDAETLDLLKKPIEEENGEPEEIQPPPLRSAFDVIQALSTAKGWKAVERGIRGYTGHSERTASRKRTEARKQHDKKQTTKASGSAQVNLMQRHFVPPSPPVTPSVPDILDIPVTILDNLNPAQLVDYASDGSEPDFGEDNPVPEEPDSNLEPVTSSSRLLSSAPPPLKRQRHAIPTVFVGGPTGLQSYRARAIQSYLIMVVKNRRGSVIASERAAESQGFAALWGGRMVRTWTRVWIKKRELPESQQGKHGKVFSLLDDPQIKAELRTYVQSHKWAMNPDKVKALAAGKLIPAAAEKYLKQLVDEEMPAGLKKYMELERFPRIQMKCSKGISLSTARRWLLSEGFRCITFKKGLFFDGHDRFDVIQY
ncbi:hypothetical protein C8J56DRAFT_880876 [Mycena floridula]|nr:hypothetical protein C8J56DRAFT_880876 [Mycena floridula]